MLNGNIIKFMAITTMFLDHLSKIVLQLLEINDFIRFQLEGIGTVAFPLFCFLLAEGFYHSKHRKRYFLLLFGFGIISEIPFDLAFFGELFYWEYQNVFFTLLLGLAALWGIETLRWKPGYNRTKTLSVLLQISCVAALVSIADFFCTDYAGKGVLFIVGFYIFRSNRLYQVLVFLFLYVITTANTIVIFSLITCAILILYNGERGKLKLKYSFYIFYPAHILLLYFVSVVLNV